jgi:hypothetical protein
VPDSPVELIFNVVCADIKAKRANTRAGISLVSEYQYYEFRTIDRILSAGEMDELRSVSSRAEITTTSFTNEYHFGDFRGDPEALMSKYFDAFVYVANWGTRRLMVRVPRGMIDVDVAKSYCDNETVKMVRKRAHVLFEFYAEEEEGDWVEGEGWMERLVPLRSALMRGDYRILYFGWLASFTSRGWFDVSDLGDDKDLKEPLVPPGLGQLTAPLGALAEFLSIDGTLIKAAALANSGEPVAEPTREDLARWLKRIPAAKKEGYLLRFLAADGDEALRSELVQEFLLATRPKSKKESGPERRTVAELLTARDGLNEKGRKASATTTT